VNPLEVILYYSGSPNEQLLLNDVRKTRLRRRSLPESLVALIEEIPLDGLPFKEKCHAIHWFPNVVRQA
jgi:hypothetical protein